ncbi:MAG: hypothetical protein M1522_00270 [Actinobacteria bacterium]|nr:hypothetical protein [Actinomycetota bacterium]
MPGIRTEITEIVTGLGVLPYATAEEAIRRQPTEMVNVLPSHWERLREAVDDPAYERDIRSAWENGRAFLRADDGLRGRTPLTVEWKGPHHPPGYDFLPADLRIDHVFLVSCKYLSRVLANPSPAHLFQRALAVRGNRSDTDWFMLVAEDAYRKFYAQVSAALSGKVSLPVDMVELTPAGRDEIKALCARRWPDDLNGAYEEFSAEVSRGSAAAWNKAVPTLADRELLLWRILRFNPAPYFILGSARTTHLRLRVATPWDWRQLFSLKDFVITAQETSQPRVGWAAEVLARHDGTTVIVEGHVEVRWSHGRFCGFPEAKLYLDSRHDDVPGYFALR